MKLIPRQYRLLIIAVLKYSVLSTLLFGSLLWAAFSVLSALGWHQITGIVFTALFGIFSLIAVFHFVSFDLLMSLKKTNEKLMEEGHRARELYERWLHDVADDVALNITCALLGVFCFTLSAIAWASFDPKIISRKAGNTEVACLVMSHTLRGNVSGYCMSLNKKASLLEFTENNSLFNFYFREYHAYIAVFALGAIFRVCHTYSLVNKFPTYRAEIRRLARYFDEA